MRGTEAGKRPPEKQEPRRTAVKGGLYILIILALFLGGMKSAGTVLGEERETLFFTAPVPDSSRVAEILDSEKNTRNPAEVCFYSDLGLERIVQKDYGRSTEVFAAAIAGNEGVLDWRLQGFESGDGKGCAIDSRTAEKLFGSRLPGGTIIFREKEYIVRKVLPVKQQILYIRPQKGESLTYERAFLREDSGGFLMRSGLSGKKVSGRFVRNISLMLLFLLPLDISVRITGKRKEKTGMARIACTLAGTALLAFVLWRLGTLLSIPGDWIPGQWSDFGFWQKKLQEGAENIRLFFLLPKTPIEADSLFSLGKTALFTLAGYCFYLKKIPFFRESAK